MDLCQCIKFLLSFCFQLVSVKSPILHPEKSEFYFLTDQRSDTKPDQQFSVPWPLPPYAGEKEFQMQKCHYRLAAAKHTDGSASLWVCGEAAWLSGTQCNFRGRCILWQVNKSQHMEAVTIMYQLSSALGFKGEKKHSRNLSCIQDDNNVILNTTYKPAVREYGTKTLGQLARL